LEKKFEGMRELCDLVYFFLDGESFESSRAYFLKASVYGQFRMNHMGFPRLIHDISVAGFPPAGGG
jgi:hypothetical protein